MAVEAPVDPAFAYIAEAVRAGRCILFLGAGVHAPPPEQSPYRYPAEQRPPIGSQLSRRLAAELGADLPEGEPDDNLQRVAMFYEIKRSRNQLVDAVAKAVHEDKRPSPMLYALAELGFPLIITTNYDQLLERALGRADKPPRVAVYSPELVPTTDFRDPSGDSPILFKIHGDIEKRDSIVITDEDYIQFVLRMSNKEPYDPVSLRLKFHLTEWTTLFIGYSLLDYNLRLLFKTLRWKIDDANVPDMFSVDFKPDPLILSVWEDRRRYVRFIAQDVWAFVPRLYELVLEKELAP